MAPATGLAALSVVKTAAGEGRAVILGIPAGPRATEATAMAVLEMAMREAMVQTAMAAAEAAEAVSGRSGMVQVSQAGLVTDGRVAGGPIPILLGKA